jgi:hypothetical protein
VISRNAVFVHKGKPVKAKEIAREFGVDYVVEGSVLGSPMPCSCSAHEQGSALARPVTVRSAGTLPSTIAAIMRSETKASGASRRVPFALSVTPDNLGERGDATEPDVVDPAPGLGEELAQILDAIAASSSGGSPGFSERILVPTRPQSAHRSCGLQGRAAPCDRGRIRQLQRSVDMPAISIPLPPLRRTNLSPGQKTLVVLSERKNGPVMMIGDGINDAVDFKRPSEIMDHFRRKGGPQGVEHGHNVNDFLGDGAAHRT